MVTIAAALKSAMQQLSATSSTAKLDAELLLGKVLDCSRSYLVAYHEQLLSEQQFKQFQKLLEQRTTRYPLAYLLGEKEFWSLNFIVTPDVLIPRPETELLVEKILAQFAEQDAITLVDLGTGSGAIACALAHEKPRWRIIATDQSQAALAIAKQNAQQLNLNNIAFYHGSWCQALPVVLKADVIVSNPPYLAADDVHLISSEISYEPSTALVAAQQGLADYETIAMQARNHLLKDNGWLFFEHGAEQAADVQNILVENTYQHIQTYTDLAGLARVTAAALI